MTANNLATIFTALGDTTLRLAANGLTLMSKGLLMLGDRCAKGSIRLYDLIDEEENMGGD